MRETGPAPNAKGRLNGERPQKIDVREGKPC
jgi:hypothetical protein